MVWADKTVCVTGASRGIGRSIAQAFKVKGAKVVGTCTNVTGADYSCDEWLIADFAYSDQIESCAKSLTGLDIDILINCAGINKIAPFADIDPLDFLKIQQVNLFAPLRLCQAVLPKMLLNQWGRIVNISSVWGKVSKEFRASYSASKFALDGMTLALAAEHGANGILSNCVSPGFIDTELTRTVLGESGIRQITQGVPIRRLGQSNEIASLVVWLASEENTYLNGQNISVDGGFSRV
jgi:3-oxoacyl-[acyl-carrier protein] reductase